MRVSHHLWTLRRLDKTTHCTVSQRPRSGTWVLRLMCNGRRILDSSFGSLGEAVAQSSLTFGALLARGWIGHTDLAGPGQHHGQAGTTLVH